MKYSKQAIDFFNGDLDVNYEVININGENVLMIDVIRHYEGGEKRLLRYKYDDFIEELYYYKRYLIDKTFDAKKKYQLAVQTKYDITSEIREMKRYCAKSDKQTKPFDFSQLIDEVNVIIDAYKLNYNTIWWRVKLPLLISLLALAMSAYNLYHKICH